MEYDFEAIRRCQEQIAASAKTDQEQSKITEVSPAELEDFPAQMHKFKRANPQRMEELKESIRQNGIINPLILRRTSSGSLQIITGHNRRLAAMQLGYRTVPCIIKGELDDAEAIPIMIADNLNNRTVLPSERGWAYRQLLELYNRQGARSDLTCAQNEHKLEGRKSRDILADEAGQNRNKIQRYIRLTYLIDPLLDLVDRQKMGMGVGVQLSYLSLETQELVYLFCYAYDPQRPLKESHAKAIREAEKDPDEVVNEDFLESLLEKKSGTERLRTLKLEMSQLREYFPKGTSEEVVVQTIHSALAMYFSKEDKV